MATRYSDDEVYDSRGVLKDGRAVRVPLMLRDSLRQQDARPRITDGRSDDPTALNRPGFRVPTVQDRRKVADAYAERAFEDENAWRSMAGGPRGAAAGDICTVREGGHDEGAPGHLHSINGRLVCVPDPAYAGHDGRTVDRKQEAFLAYDKWVAEQWKVPL
jgi:hypothetical protein